MTYNITIIIQILSLQKLWADEVPVTGRKVFTQLKGYQMQRSYTSYCNRVDISSN